jgi:hypothetical protein
MASVITISIAVIGALFAATYVKEWYPVSSAQPIIIGVVDEHHHVLKFWLDAYYIGKIPKGGVPILHVDSHSDGSLPFNEYEFKTLEEDPNPNVAVLINYTNIGDFIPVAQYMGILDARSLWIQRNWSDQAGLDRIGMGFNFPPGNYTQILKKRDIWDPSDFDNDMMIEERQTCICYKNSEGILLNGIKTDKGLQNLPRRKGICDDSRSLEEEETETEYQERLDILQPKNPEKLITWYVRHVHDEKGSYSFVNELIGPKDSPYILDIDEDYFATLTPVISHSADPRKVGHFFEYLRQMLSSESGELCLNKKLPDTVFTKQDLEIKNETLRVIHYNTRRLNKLIKKVAYEGFLILGKEGRKKYSSYKVISSFTKNTMQLWCKGKERGQRALEMLTKLFMLYTTQVTFFNAAVLRTEYEFPSIECRSNFLYGVCHYTDISHPVVTRDEIIKNLKMLQQLIHARGRPTVVTIARSCPDYTPEHLQQFIERNVIDMLKNEFKNVDVQYYESLKPVQDNPLITDVTYFNQTRLTELENAIESLTDKQVVAMYKKNRKKLKQMALLRTYMDNSGASMFEIMVRPDEFINWAEYELHSGRARIKKTDEEKF